MDNDLYFIKASDLDNPAWNVDSSTLYNCMPFYNDYYVVVYLKPVHKREPELGARLYRLPVCDQIPSLAGAEVARGHAREPLARSLLYTPTIINDPDLIKHYGADSLQMLMVGLVANFQQIRSPTYRVRFRLLVLHGGWWCAYIEKQHLWDGFRSTGIITLLSPTREAVVDYFNTNFKDHLFKKSRFRRNNMSLNI